MGSEGAEEELRCKSGICSIIHTNPIGRNPVHDNAKAIQVGGAYEYRKAVFCYFKAL